jgi:hypothetical protein
MRGRGAAPIDRQRAARGLSDNPLAGRADANARRIIAFGLKNSFRFTFRPGTNEVSLGDVGDEQWEEIDRVSSKDCRSRTSAGWPGNNVEALYRDVGNIGHGESAALH